MAGVMDVTKIIALLRERAMVGRMEVRDKQLMIMAANALEERILKEDSCNGSKQDAPSTGRKA